MKIFVVVPFYNENKHISQVIKGVSKYHLPMIVVDDGSTDNPKIKSGKDVKLITHKINLGKGAAMKTGAEYAFKNGADAVIFMDGDNQHNAKDLPKFVDALKTEKYEIVLGTRNFSYGVPLVRFLGNKFAALVLVIFFRIYVSDVLCGYKALTKKAYKNICWESTGYGVETEMIARMGKTKLPYREVSVESIYHDKTKGVTLLDAFGIMGEIVKWKFTI